MSATNLFTAGKTSDLIPEGDSARQAVDSLRGYAYQALASAVAWIDIDENERIYFEVAEDYAHVANEALKAVQVKDTAASGSVTLKSGNVRDAVASFIDLVARNPSARVSLRYLTTSPAGTERAESDRLGGMAGLDYWRKAAAGADVTPLRQLLESNEFPDPVRDYVRSRNDARLRAELLQRIMWDCGQPSFGDLRTELEERLIVVGRDRFGLPAGDARGLANVLAFRVLCRSVVKDHALRVLKRSELYEILSEAAEVSLPRTALASLLAQQTSGLTGAFDGAGGQTSMVAAGEPTWLIQSRTMAPPGRFITRPAVQEAVAGALGRSGVAILTGASGLGKSHVARVAAEAHADAFAMIDFRDVDAVEARRRLDITFGRVGGLDASVIVFEDLTQLDDPQVCRSLSRVMQVLRHRDRVGLVTCYRAPSPRTFATAGLDPGSIVECPYFTEDESRELVALYGGDPGLWGRLAHVAGAWGHPQLTHAFVTGLSGRNWPRSELRDIVGRGLTSEDIDAERESARRNLLNALPDHARSLLYRLSLLIGRFSRSTALALGAAPPPVTQAGEAMDLLVGPWIEVLASDQYRVSPLASGTGRSQLSSEEQECLHASIAKRMLAGRTVNASDIDSIAMHALIGKEDLVLFKLSTSIINLPKDKLSLLAESATILRLIEPETSFSSERMSIAVMLRLAQFKLLDAGTDKDKAANAALVAMKLVSEIDDQQLKQISEILVLSTVSATMNVADYFDDWLAWLQRWQKATASPGFASELRSGFEEGAQASGTTPSAMFFVMGAAQISSVARLEKIIDDLGNLNATDRAAFLTPVDKTMSDYSLFINGPWSGKHRGPDFDAAAAAAGYGRIAEKTKDWGIPALAIQPRIAQAIVLDEFMNEGDQALAVLDEAVKVLGESPLLARAQAKIYFRRQDYSKAQEILGRIADIVGADNPIERTFALREAAISAAHCNDWQQAEAWFNDAASAAAAATPGTDDLRAMAIGLGADAAAAAFRRGRVAIALGGLDKALTALAAVDPEASLKNAYVHRVVRHVAAWAQSQIEGRAVEIDGQPLDVPPGACSNPDPPEAIRQLPLAAIDTARYTLAESEIAAGVDAGIGQSLHGRLVDGPIPMLEMMLCTGRMKRAVEKSDAAAFASNLPSFVNANVYVHDKMKELREGFDTISPPRGQVPSGNLTTVLAEQIACDAVLAFGLRALFADNTNVLASLQTELQQQLGPAHLGRTSFVPASSDSVADLSQTVKAILDAYRNGTTPGPQEFWGHGFRLFQQLEKSNFGRMLYPICATWLRQRWTSILQQQRFLLRQPFRSVPPIQEALAQSTNDRPFVAGLLLAALDAVPVRLPPSYLAELRQAVSEKRAAA